MNCFLQVDFYSHGNLSSRPAPASGACDRQDVLFIGALLFERVSVYIEVNIVVAVTNLSSSTSALPWTRSRNQPKSFLAL